LMLISDKKEYVSSVLSLHKESIFHKSLHEADKLDAWLEIFVIRLLT